MHIIIDNMSALYFILLVSFMMQFVLLASMGESCCAS